MSSMEDNLRRSAAWPTHADRALRLPLVVSSYTLGTEAPLQERVQAAAAAGFDGIGLRADIPPGRRAALLHAAIVFTPRLRQADAWEAAQKR